MIAAHAMLSAVEDYSRQQGAEQFNAGAGLSRAEARAFRPLAFPACQSAMCHWLSDSFPADMERCAGGCQSSEPAGRCC